MELERCPFCGGEVNVWQGNKSYHWAIECKKCHLDMPSSDDNWFTSKENAIKAWNTRAKPQGLSFNEIKNIIFDFHVPENVRDEMAKTIYEAQPIKSQELSVEEIQLCPVNCKYCNPEENHPMTKGHVCELFNERIKHFNCHPRLVRCDDCLYIATAIFKAQKEKINEGLVE